MTEDALSVSRAYDEVAELYAEHAGSAFAVDPLHRAMVDAFADMVCSSGGGTVLDAGCGPGHISAHLVRRGLAVVGVDLAPKALVLAGDGCPSGGFVVGRLEELPLVGGSVAGVLSSYSIIHTPPERLPGVLAQMVRVLAGGGYLLVSFQSQEDPTGPVEVFDHQVATAYRYGVDHVLAPLREAGIVEVARCVLAGREDARRGFAQAHLLCRKEHPST
ncbi:class I SAM-dependent DNA methyltransferase [Nocardiopsis sp. NPDC055551]